MSGRRLSEKRRRWLLGAAAFLLIAVAAIANAGESNQGTPASKTQAQTSSQPETTTTAESAGEEGPEGLPEPRGAAQSPGTPLKVARAFAEAWINRPTSGSELAQERSRLLALSRGELATRISFAFIQQKAESGGESGSRGSVLSAQIVARPSGGQLVEALVTTREQLTENGNPSEPPRYSLYLARLERAGGGYLLSDWQPQ